MGDQLRILGRPLSRLGTPAHAGPYSRLRKDTLTKAAQGFVVAEKVQSGLSIRAAASELGMSVTTAWRRYWFLRDLIDAGGFGIAVIPHQRGTKACPNGRPILLPLDSFEVYQQLRESGATDEQILTSRRVVPACVRRHAEQAIELRQLDLAQLERSADRLMAKAFAAGR